MEIEGGVPIQNAGEYAVDFTMAQLVETAPEFRRWFLRQATSYRFVEEYLGATVHATYAGEGESDIEFGVVTESDDRHLVLIENKIDAAKQPDQLQRYHKRGEFRITRQDWDSFSVCLLAPEGYVSAEDEAGVDAVVSYEAVLEELGTLTHDSATFFESVFEAALRKPVIADASETLTSIVDHFEESYDFDHIEPAQGQNKSLVFNSSHPDHHDAIGYNVYIVEKGDGGRTKIRLKIAGGDELTDAELDRIKSLVSDHRDELSDYEWMLNRKSDIGAKTLWHDEVAPDGFDDQYVETVTAELATLIETFHPLFVQDDAV